MMAHVTSRKSTKRVDFEVLVVILYLNLKGKAFVCYTKAITRGGQEYDGGSKSVDSLSKLGCLMLGGLRDTARSKNGGK